MITCALRIALIAVLAILATSTEVHAVTCTIQGIAQIEPMDTYYCDSSLRSCAGWNETNLHGTKPLRNMYLSFNVGGTVYAGTSTSASGAYSATLNLPSCTETIGVTFYLMRQNPGTTWPIFKIVDENNLVHAATWAVPLTGSTTTYNPTFSRGSATEWRRAINVYYTVDSALTEMRSWSTNLANRLGGSSAAQTITVLFHVGQGFDNADDLAWGIKLGYDRYHWGANSRHELGHMVHMAAHHQNLIHRSHGCVSLRLNRPGENNHGEESCEYAAAATWEGLASFFAIRSIVEGAGENGAFFCFGGCSTPTTNQNFCSDAAVAALDADRNQFWPPCTGSLGWFTGVGDMYANGQSRCVRLRESQGCSCPDTDNDDYCDWTVSGDNWNVTNGYRNEANTYRFFWDILDDINEGGLDDTNMSINSFIAGMQSMLCAPTGGIDGTCNETSPTTCKPTLDWLQPTTHASGDRDSYNVHDLSEHAGIPGAQDGERLVNCVHNAPDLDP